jgi:RNA polymerase sigma-70 factor (sigma-B/F/G subfamily)
VVGQEPPRHTGNRTSAQSRKSERLSSFLPFTNFLYADIRRLFSCSTKRCIHIPMWSEQSCSGIPSADAPRPDWRGQLVLRHMPAARRIAQAYRSPRHQEDLEQVAYLGLAKAAERFEPARGVQFLSYATPTIHGEIKRYLRDHGWDVHVPRPLQERARRARQARDALTAELGRAPRINEIAERLGEEADSVREALQVMTARSAHSLESLSEHAEGTAPPRALAMKAAESDGFESVLERAALRSALATLPEDERYTIGLRYIEELTQDEIASRTGVSQMTVSRRLNRALDRVRRYGENKHVPKPHAPAHASNGRPVERSLIVPVLDRDPDLGAALSAEEYERARRLAAAAALTYPTGRWSVESGDWGADGFGLLLLAGLLVRKVTVQGQTCAEVLGPGDIVQPGQVALPGSSLAAEVSWEVVDALQLAVLDGGFVSRVARWPAIAVAVAKRVAMRTHWLSFQLSICRLRRIDERLLLLLWHFANRWGRVTARGVQVRLPLTHGLLALMIGARRPPVTTAIRLLTDAGSIDRPAPAEWLLLGSPPAELGLASTAELEADAHSPGEARSKHQGDSRTATGAGASTGSAR